MINIKEFLKSYGFTPKHSLGQNFLLDLLALEKIVEAADLKKSDQVLEIGTGIANLTKMLAEQAGEIITVEKDQTYFPIIKDQLGEILQSHSKTPKSSANVKLVFADIMTFNFQELVKPGYKVVANIPYYITGKIVEMLLAAKNRPSKIVLLIQKEVAERIVAEPGNMSILSISVQLYAKAKMVRIVPKESFYPIPEVDSAILVLDLLDKPLYPVDEKKFFRIIKAVFAGKRKQIHNTLKNNLKLTPEQLVDIFKLGIIEPTSRPQELSLEQWYNLYKIIEKQG